MGHSPAPRATTYTRIHVKYIAFSAPVGPARTPLKRLKWALSGAQRRPPPSPRPRHHPHHRPRPPRRRRRPLRRPCRPPHPPQHRPTTPRHTPRRQGRPTAAPHAPLQPPQRPPAAAPPRHVHPGTCHGVGRRARVWMWMDMCVRVE